MPPPPQHSYAAAAADRVPQDTDGAALARRRPGWVTAPRYTMGGSDDDEDAGTGAGDYVKSLVFGGLDGIITTFAIVATVAGARAHPGLVLLMGAANLVADALSMGIGDYLSERAEDEYVASEQRRELAELRNGTQSRKVAQEPGQ